ncbi:oxygenase MpaB family protein [Paractinoplanes durhamensis]|uniref:Peptidase n=1 Tax=Paractinoplanes durhamensis TaxID=113563 RepID=A0ABQ3YY20_9ACTN|nr:oxygenase MpaB family protein [Actinoplanes durhamensis]GIE02462.1 peptidase [Actinoplanes durhamensis]
MRTRYANLARTRTLDPARDYEQIFRTMLRFEFPWDLRLALNLAFNRSFSVPAVAEILIGTGELTERPRKRADDTGILMYEMVLHGFDHPRARAAIRRVNQIHRPYRHVSPDEYVYVLAAGVVLPLRWLDRYGWRRPCCHEREATYQYFRELGRHMNVTGMPASLAETEAWFESYDRTHLIPNEAAATIERTTRERMLKRLPRPLSPLGNSLVSAIYDERQRKVAGLATPPWPVRAALHTALTTRSRLIRHLHRPRPVGLFEDGIPTRTYPDGYDISQVGP